MKYPSVYLDGEGARGTMLSIAFANAGQHQDTGAKMIHNAPHTSSSIVSKSIAKGGGKVDYRGQVTFNKNSKKSVSHIECDTIIMDDLSASDTIRLTKFTTHKLLWSTKPRYLRFQKNNSITSWVVVCQNLRQQRWLSWDCRALYKRTSNGICSWAEPID